MMAQLLENFHWLRPAWLWALLPAALLLYGLWLAAQRQGAWRQAVDPALLPHLLEGSTSARRRWPFAALGLGLALAIVSLAGPAWERLPQPAVRSLDTLIVIADMTLSMHAADLQPSRLVRARYKLLELLARRDEGQTALIVYSGDAHLVSPLTDDSSTIAALVPALSPEIMPAIGSNATAAFALAREVARSAGSSPRPHLLWLTDELLPEDAAALRQTVQDGRMRLSVLGAGSSGGAPIRLPSGQFLKRNSEIVTARLNRDELRALTHRLGGDYQDLRADNRDIERILAPAGAGAGVHTATREGPQVDAWEDAGVWLVLALLPLVLAGFRRGWIIAMGGAFLVLAPPPGHALEWQDLWQRTDQQAAAALAAGDPARAAELFDDPAWRGIARYRDGDFAGAASDFSAPAAASASDHYNRGHALARGGQLREALAAYDRALAQQPGMRDAQQARQLVEDLLRRQQQQQQQQQQQPGQQQQQQQQGQQGQSAQPQQAQRQPAATRPRPDAGQRLPPAPAQQAPPAQTTQQAAADSQPGEPRASAEAQAAEDRRLARWLRQIRDDPGGLLRRKFEYQRRQREQSGDAVTRRKDGQLW